MVALVPVVPTAAEKNDQGLLLLVTIGKNVTLKKMAPDFTIVVVVVVVVS